MMILMMRKKEIFDVVEVVCGRRRNFSRRLSGCEMLASAGGEVAKEYKDQWGCWATRLVLLNIIIGREDGKGKGL